jgi:hypothetical protein
VASLASWRCCFCGTDNPFASSVAQAQIMRICTNSTDAKRPSIVECLREHCQLVSPFTTGSVPLAVVFIVDITVSEDVMSSWKRALSCTVDLMPDEISVCKPVLSPFCRGLFLTFGVWSSAIVTYGDRISVYDLACPVPHVMVSAVTLRWCHSHDQALVALTCRHYRSWRVEQYL